LRRRGAFEGIHPGIPYPPVLLVTAMNDVRVPYWQSTKLAARLQQDSSSHAPALVHITDGGHLGGGDAEPQFLLDAQLLAFALSSVHSPSR
jgi:prolyl oligopeptidase